MSMSRMGMLLPMNRPFPAQALSVSQLAILTAVQLMLQSDWQASFAVPLLLSAACPRSRVNVKTAA